MFIWDFVAAKVLGQIVDWFYSQIVGFLGNFFSEMGNMGVELVRVLGKTRRYMEDHLADPLTIPALSRMAMLSATTFKDAFRRLYGLPVHAWLRQRRMERAAELLRDSSLSVLGVAQSVGYGSASQFTAAFRRQYGMTPAKYRKDV